MDKKELYEYCGSNTNTRRYLIEETAEPLWKIVTSMISTGKDIQAFELDVRSISMYLWAELTARCNISVSMSEAENVIVDYFLPSLERNFKMRIKDTIGSDENDIAIYNNGNEAIMVYGNNNLVLSAKKDFIRYGKQAFLNT